MILASSSRHTTQDALLKALEAISLPETLKMQGKNPDDKLPHERLKDIAAAIHDISKNYVEDGKSSSFCLPTDAHLHAYILYYLPLNAVKVLHLLTLIEDSFASKEELSILDFGCGPGTASLTASLFFDKKLSITAVDENDLMLRGAASLLKRVSSERPVSFETRRSLPADRKYDLIFACNVLNELSGNDRSSVLTLLNSALNEDGICIILEPGTSSATRKLMKDRDAILTARPSLNILYPCTHKLRCPLLKSPDDWCHTEMFFESTTLIRQLDTLTGFNKHKIKFSAFIFANGSKTPDGYRVITETEKFKGGVKTYLCGNSYSGIITLLKRNRTDANRALEKVRMHDHVAINPPLSTDNVSKEQSAIILSRIPEK